MSDNALLGLIVGCEIAFWLLLLAGLVVRYLLNLEKLSTILLICVPLVDVVLLAASMLDLSRGSVATFAHGLAAAYIGFSIAFGGVTIGWVDNRFAQKYSDAAPPPSAPTFGWDLIRYEFVWWLRCLLAVAVTQVLVFAAISFINDAEKSSQLELWLTWPLISVALWFVFGPLWVIVFYRGALHSQ